jgi:hypothetical protein
MAQKPMMFAKIGNIYDIVDETITLAEIEAMIDTIYPETMPEGVKKFGNISPESPWALTIDAADDIEIETWDQVSYVDPGKIKWGATVTRVDMTPSAVKAYFGAIYNAATKLWGVPDPTPRIKRLLVVAEDAYGTRYGQIVPIAVITAGDAPTSPVDNLVGFPLKMKFLRDATRRYFHLGGELLRPVDGSGTSVLTADEVTAVNITDGGEDHLVPPTVTFIGGGGTGATATALIDADGTVHEVEITDGGSGYITAPLVQFTRVVA